MMERHNKSIGELRSSQLITTFGIGAVVDFLNYSVMILGQNYWNLNNLNTIREERLERKLHVDKFMHPKIDYSAFSSRIIPTIPCIRFPEWVFCPNCKRFAPYYGFDSSLDIKFCKICSTKIRYFPLIPARFVISCENGHINDFPWIWWVHKGERCNSPDLRISATGRSTSLSSIIISCETCKSERTLEGIFRKYALKGMKCKGRRPWLKDNQDCDAEPVALQRGSASVWFPEMESAISIPPFSSNIFKLFLFPEIENLFDSIPVDVLPEVLKGYVKKMNIPYSVETVIDAYKRRKKYKESDSIEDLRFEEYLALTNPSDREKGSNTEFSSRDEKVPHLFQPLISKIMLIDRLREVRALKAFKRINPESEKVSRLSSKEENWLPAIEVRGEGIFIELNEKSLKSWKKGGGEALMGRSRLLENRKRALRQQGKWVPDSHITPEFLLIHTLAHLLIQQLTIECGYSSAALRERLYTSEESSSGQPMFGFLIYTASADSEGSMGGLVRQGQTKRFEEVLINTLEKAKWCSNDPLGLESLGQGMNSLNLAACHACTLLPETSCELRNCYLDRGFVIGLRDNPSLGFFHQIIY